MVRANLLVNLVIESRLEYYIVNVKWFLVYTLLEHQVCCACPGDSSPDARDSAIFVFDAGASNARKRSAPKQQGWLYGNAPCGVLSTDDWHLKWGEGRNYACPNAIHLWPQSSAIEEAEAVVQDSLILGAAFIEVLQLAAPVLEGLVQTMSPHEVDVETVRTHFPALAKYPQFVFGDNAGGSQTLQESIDRVVDYLGAIVDSRARARKWLDHWLTVSVSTNIQMGSDYMPASTQRCMSEAQKITIEMFNAASPDEIVFGGSSTQNLENLSRGLEDGIQSGDEIIVTQEHEG
jgi:hypothetical protein